MIWRHVSVDGGVLGVSGDLRWVSADLVLQIGQVCIDFLERSNLALDHLDLSLSRTVLSLASAHGRTFSDCRAVSTNQVNPTNYKLYLSASQPVGLGASLPAAAPLVSDQVNLKTEDDQFGLNIID
jgi:hypothetical protein